MDDCELGSETCLEEGGQCQPSVEEAVVTVPRAYSRSPGNAAPAVATKWSVLFVVNPSPDIYTAYYDFCAYGANTKTGFQIDSAYGPIRIWRVDAFVEDAVLAAQMRRDDVSLTIE
eukprot:3829294-Rhodomonas_salina.1